MTLTFELSDNDLASLQDHQNPYLSRPEKGLALWTALIGRPPQSLDDAAAQQLAALRALVHEDYLQLGDGYPGTARVYRELGALVDALQELVLFPVLANKTVVGIGGGFSAGKSRFVNSLLGTSLLPEALEPSTAIPTFVLQGTAGIMGVNVFHQQVALDTDALGAISHDFHTQYRERFGVEVGFAHVLRDLLLHTPDFGWPNLALLDTPGYNRSDSEHNTLRDDALALAQLRNADHVLWLVKGSNGDLRADDAQFLRQVAPRHPVFFVVSQADLMAPGDVDAVVDRVRQSARAAGLECAGVGAWAAPIHETQGCTHTGDDVLSWLDRLATAPKHTDKRRQCSALLDEHTAHNTKLLADNRQLLGALNKVQVLAKADAAQTAILTTQIARLKEEQQAFNQRITAVSHLKAALMSGIQTLLGDQVLDAAPPAMREIIRSLAPQDDSASWSQGTLYPCQVRASLADLKRLQIGFAHCDARVSIPYSAVQKIWQRDPVTVLVGEALQARVLALAPQQVTLAFSDSHA